MSTTEETLESAEPTVAHEAMEGEVEGGEEEDELSYSSDSEIEEALDWLDSRDDGAAIEGGGFTLSSRRPNAHGGLHSRSNSSTLQPLSNRNQKFAHHIRASPLEV